MTIFGRILAAAIVALATARAAEFLVLAAWETPNRMAVYFTEPQMVHLSRQAHAGATLYPEWKSLPYVVNVFTPGYFLAVGKIAKASDASLEGTQWIGRGVTMLFAGIAAFAIALAFRRFGRAAMISAAGMTLGSGVLMGFGWMARPDVTADALGFAGFLSALSTASVAIPVTLLALAVFCKQTAGLYLLAAAVALVWEARTRRSICIAAATVVVLTLAIAFVWLSGEPRMMESILLEGSSPWRLDHWKAVGAKLVGRCGDLVVFCVGGVIVWIGTLRSPNVERRTQAKRWLTLAICGGIVGGIGSAKLGSDLNYFLPLRFVAAAGVAWFVAALLTPPVKIRTAAAGLVVIAALGYWSLPATASILRHAKLDPGARRRADVYAREIEGLVVLGRNQRILTNCDDAALRLGNPFVDSFVFKMLADDGRLNPSALEERIRSGEYDWVVTTAELDDPNYVASVFGMPARLATVILERYERSHRQTLVYYRKRK